VDPLTNPAFIVFTFLSPLLIAVIKQSGLSSSWNAVIAFACYIVIGVAGAILEGQALTIENIVPFIATATVVGTAAYNLIWANLSTMGGTPVEERIEVATSVVK
jgi:hypothetical protein